ncbi:hypothetical protein GW17_00031650 [Ensete ventricosum]|nr:hypothetical protein GW17_00031650 [Ensete ventricosum]RZR95885.1 hypothetical protein BHM03_00024791 [Ensete ventricosum]
MVFKGRFFSSSKKSDSSSSPDGSNSPGGSTFGSPSTARSDKKKPKSNAAPAAASPRHTLIKDAVEKHHLQHQQKKKDKDAKDSKGKDSAHASSPKLSPPAATAAADGGSSPAKLRKGAAVGKDGTGPAAALSPILVSSLGLNRIKTRSGPLPQEGLRGEHRMSGLGSSNLSRSTGATSSLVSSTSMARVGVDSGGAKDGRTLDKVPESCTSSWADIGGGGAKQWFTASVKFEKAKDEVNSDLAIFAGDLVSIMEKNLESHPEWKEILEDLLILARSCCVMSPGEFWLQCEGLVQDLDDRRQELPSGMLKKLHTHMLFILTRCTRLLQFHKESGFAEDEMAMDPGSKKLHSAEVASVPAKDSKHMFTMAEKNSVETVVSRKSYSQEQYNLKWKRSQEIKPANFFSQLDIAKDDSPSSRERIASWKPLPSPAPKDKKKSIPLIDESPNGKVECSQLKATLDKGLITTDPPKQASAVHASVNQSVPSKHQHNVSWGFWSDQQSISEEGSIMCRICEEYVPTSFVEEHSKVCAVADRCDQKGLSVDERLIRIAETLEKMVESYKQKDLPNVLGSPDVLNISCTSLIEESDIPYPKLSDWSRRGSADMLDSLHETENTLLFDDLKNLSSMTCKTRFGSKSDQGMTTSSAGSMTPRSPIMTPRASHIDMLLAGKNATSECDDLPQVFIIK